MQGGVPVPRHQCARAAPCQQQDPWYNLRAATDSLRSNWGQVRMPARHNPRAPQGFCASNP